jgi:hypothetical protein
MNTTEKTSNQEKIVETEILIIGFGFSSIPLIREFEKGNKDYIIISDGSSIWDKLEKNERLDFDLVSSKHTSLYSFELVNLDTKDTYPTSKEFLDFQRKYFKKYGSNVVKDWVEEVQNYPEYSMVYTRSGEVYKVKHLVISTAFKRKMNQVLNDFDFSATKNKTVVLTSFGDSGNLIASKLIHEKAKVILYTNGFLCLDKMSFYKKQAYTLDQLEMHNFKYISKFIYQTLVSGAGVVNVAGVLPKKTGNFLFGDSIHMKFPLADRTKRITSDFKRKIKSPIPNGLIVVKYWPIDAYQHLFDNENLEDTIEKGYLMNDIGFYLENNLIEVCPKEGTELDRDNNRIQWGDKTISYDYIIDGDREEPNLPKIVYQTEESSNTLYRYEYRNNFMGILPKELSNVYFLGYTRPTTGGLCNIIEMQSLFAHKMIVNEDFNKSIYDDLDAKIEKYNRDYYTTDEKRPTDHLVYYGYYIEDIAKLLGIASSLSDCRSVKDVLQYYFSPNNTFKYRQSGAYKVDGVKEMFEKIWKEHKGYSILRKYVLNYLLTQISIFTCLILLPIPRYVSIPICIIQALNPFMGLVLSRGANLYSLLNSILLVGLITTCFYPAYWIFAISLCSTLLIIIIGRKQGWTRVFFNDMKNKRRYMDFYKRYTIAFEKVLKKRKRKQAQLCEEV